MDYACSACSVQAGYFFDTKLIKEYNYICNADLKSSHKVAYKLHLKRLDVFKAETFIFIVMHLHNEFLL